MTPADALGHANAGRLLPVYVVMGEEQLLRDEVVAALRSATLAGGVAAFNEDRFTAGEASVEAVVGAARTVPMMASRRFVLVRGAERWEGSESDSSAFEKLLAYALAPVESTCMVIVAAKLDGRRKFALAARKGGYIVACDPLDDRALPSWIGERCLRRGHAVDRTVAELIAALVGPQLSPIDDAIERLSLYVGPRARFDESAVGECVARIRSADTWALVDALRSRDLGRALRTLADAYDPRDRGIMLLERWRGRFGSSLDSRPLCWRAHPRTRPRRWRGSFSACAPRSSRRALGASGHRKWNGGSSCSPTPISRSSGRGAPRPDPSQTC